MRQPFGMAVLAAIVIASAGCAAQPSRTSSGTNSRIVTQAELSAGTQMNLFDFVSANRPRWLQPRSTGSIPTMGTAMTEERTSVTIYVDQAKMGGPEVLRSFAPRDVRELRYYDLAEAQQRFSDRNLGVVIQILTK